jgi:hypothetical protein
MMLRGFLIGLMGLLSGLLWSCAHTGPPTMVEFTSQILEPLAISQTDEHLAQARAEIERFYALLDRSPTPDRPPPSTQALFNKLDDLGIPNVHSINGLFFNQEGDSTVRHRHVWRADHDEMLAWLDKQRLPLNQIILNDLVTRTTVTGTTFTACVDGEQHRYQAQGNSFIGPVVLATTCGRTTPHSVAGRRN